MSGYNGRRGPNVSSYVQQLNNIPMPQDLGAQDDDFGNFQDEMAMFTNTEFYDFGLSEIGDLNQSADSDATRPTSASFSNEASPETFGKEFAFQDLPYPAGLDIKPAQAQNISLGPQTSPVAASPITRSHMPHAGDKRKLDFMADPTSAQVMEEASRIAAEEDKRRRNTAASARFRIKKKQREQALEKTAKEMTERVAKLEAENEQLKMENKWLKGLIVEKGDKAKVEGMPKHVKAETQESESKESSRKDGVGTAK